MSSNRIISTNAFDAFQTNNGIVINENKSAYLKMSLFIFVLGIICVSFSYVVAEIPIKKILISILSNGLFYGGLIAVFGSLLYVLLSFDFIKKKAIVFDKYERMLYYGRRKIPFDSIKEFTCESNKLFGYSLSKIKIKESSIAILFITIPSISKGETIDLKKFVDELNELIRK